MCRLIERRESSSSADVETYVYDGLGRLITAEKGTSSNADAREWFKLAHMFHKFPYERVRPLRAATVRERLVFGSHYTSSRTTLSTLCC